MRKYYRNRTAVTRGMAGLYLLVHNLAKFLGESGSGGDMTFELSVMEHQMLVEILDERLRSLRSEIQHTDTRGFKAMLQERERILERLVQRIAAPTAA